MAATEAISQSINGCKLRVRHLRLRAVQVLLRLRLAMTR